MPYRSLPLAKPLIFSILLLLNLSPTDSFQATPGIALPGNFHTAFPRGSAVTVFSAGRQGVHTTAVAAGSQTAPYQPVGEIVLPTGDRYMTRAVEEKDGYAYVLTRDGYLYTYDVSDLPTRDSFTTYSHPLSTQQLPNGNGLLRNGAYLYAFGDKGLSILDIQDPSAPTVIDSKEDLIIINLIQHQNFLIAPGVSAIAVYAIDNPAHPVLSSIYRTSGTLLHFSAAVFNQTLYIYRAWIPQYGPLPYVLFLLVFDFSNPSNLVLIRVIERNSIGYHLHVIDDTLIECSENYHVFENVKLWSLVIPTRPVFRDSRRAHARACALDGRNIVVNGEVFRSNGHRLETVATFEPGFIQIDGVPYGSAISPLFVFIPQSPRVLILQRDLPQ
jgi:hypothetical protein